MNITNYTRYSIVGGTAYIDSIYNYAGGAKVYGYGGDDYIYNSTRSTLQVNDGYGYVTLSGGDGNDTIESIDPRVSISGGAGADKISVYSSKRYSGITIDGGEGDDVIYGNSLAGGLYRFRWGDGYDSIYGWNSADTLNLIGGGYYSRSTVDGNVIIRLHGIEDGTVSLVGASGKTVNIVGGTLVSPIYNYTTNNIVGGNSAGNVIYNYAGGAKVYGYGGDDYIYNSTRNTLQVNGGYGYVTLSGGDGNDTIESTDPRVSIYGGAGADKISVYTSARYSDITIDGGKGNDTIYGNSLADGLYRFRWGDGNDKIYGWNSADTLSLVGGSYYSRSTVDGNVIVRLHGIEDGTVSLVGASGKTVNIVGGTLVSPIYNYTTNKSVGGNSAGDVIYNYAGGAKVYGYGGNDYIFNSTRNTLQVNGGYGYVTLSGGDGNDTIESTDPRVSIVGGAGNDMISVYSYANYSDITIDGSEGDDTIYGNSLAGGLYRFRWGDGYDSIYGWNSADTLNLIGGGYYSRSTVSGNVIVRLHGIEDGAVSIVGASDKTVNISGGTLVSPIYNYTINKSVSGNSAGDVIYNYAGGAKISGNGGDDYIYNSTNSNYTINGGYGYVTLSGGAGNDTIESYDPHVSIYGGSGDDKISIRSNSKYNGITVRGGLGNDTIYGNSLAGSLYQFYFDSGKDIIYGWNSSDTLNLGGAHYKRSNVSGSVVVSLSSAAVTLSGASDKTVNITNGVLDSDEVPLNINNTVSGKTITATDLKDTITNSGSNVKIYAYGGNDSIYNSGGSNITISAGTGDDSINISFAETISIDAGNGNDSILGNNNYATINGGAGADSIVGNHWRSKIYGGTDNDLISLTTYWYNTIDGGDGSDTIYAAGSQHSVSGGAGADKISLSGDNLTINGGTGNDIIYGSTVTSHLYQYKSGDGNDTIYNWSATDTLTVTGGNYTTKNSGSNVLVSVGSDKITLYGAKGKIITINGKVVNPSASDDKVTPQDVIKKFMQSLDTESVDFEWTNDSRVSAGTKVLDAAIKAASNKFSTVDEVITAIYNDCKSYGADGASRFLLEKCGIDLSNADTGAITGYNAGGSDSIKNAEDIIPEVGTKTAYNYTTFDVIDGNKTYNNLKVTLADNSPDKDQKHIWDCFYTWWAKESLDLIEKSYGYSFADSDATVRKLSFQFVDEASYKAATGWTPDGNSLKLIINSGLYNNFADDDYSCQSINNNSNSYLDKTISHELTHAIMMAKVDNFYCLPQFITEGLADLTPGTEDTFRGPMMLSLAKDPDSFKNALNMTPGTGNNYSYAAGFVFLRYLAKQSSYLANVNASSFEVASGPKSAPAGTTEKSTLLTVSKKFKGSTIDLSEYSSNLKNIKATSFTKNLTLFGTSGANSLKSGKGSDQLFGGAGADTIYGGAGADMLSGGSGNDKLFGDAGNDSIYGGTGNDTLTGGTGNDIFIYESGNDVITDYAVGDKVKLSSGSLTKSTIKGSNVVLTVGKNTLTLQKAAGLDITIIDGDDNVTTKTYGSKLKTVTNSTKSPVTVPAYVETISASKRTKAVKITGNALGNTIVGGTKADTLLGGKGNDSISGGKGADKLYGGAGNDTLTGGKGNDSLWGDAGKDTFIYNAGDGKDVISGFENDDLLKITGTFSAPTYNASKNSVAFKVGSGSVTLKDFGTTTLFHVNDDTYQLSGNKLTRL